MNNSSKAKILEYAKSTGSAVSTYFTPPGQSSPVPFNNIVTTLMTDFSELFIYSTSFNKSISDLDTSNVINMTSVFYGAVAFNQDISNWDVSKVVNFSFTFSSAISFNQDISKWNVSNAGKVSKLEKQSDTKFSSSDYAEQTKEGEIVWKGKSYTAVGPEFKTTSGNSYVPVVLTDNPNQNPVNININRIKKS